MFKKIVDKKESIFDAYFNRFKKREEKKGEKNRNNLIVRKNLDVDSAR